MTDPKFVFFPGKYKKVSIDSINSTPTLDTQTVPIAAELFGAPPASHPRNFSIDRQC